MKDKTGVYPKISIIVPIYRVEHYLKRCVDSICAQTYRNIEIILVDDGSDDNCPEICDEYANLDERVVVIHRENGGLSAARNSGIEIATGDYIAFVDSDDFIEPLMYEKMLETVQKNNTKVVICNYDYVDIDGKKIDCEESKSPLHDGVMDENEILNAILGENGWYYVTAWNKIYVKEIWDKIRFPLGKTHEDEFVIHNVLSICKNVSVISERFYHYVQNKNSIMHIGYSVKRLDRIEALINRMRDCSCKMSYLWTARMMWLIDCKFSEAKVYTLENEAIASKYIELKMYEKDILDQLTIGKRVFGKIYVGLQKNRK